MLLMEPCPGVPEPFKVTDEPDTVAPAVGEEIEQVSETSVACALTANLTCGPSVAPKVGQLESALNSEFP